MYKISETLGLLKPDKTEISHVTLNKARMQNNNLIGRVNKEVLVYNFHLLWLFPSA